MIADCETEIRQCIERQQQTYERFVLREIDRETYQALKDGYTEQLEKFNSQIIVLRQAERDRLAMQNNTILAKHTLSDTAVSREIVETLIDKITVFPGDRIDIYWKILDFTKTERRNAA